jgi:D-alanyl-D-alanine carboxypeptidase
MKHIAAMGAFALATLVASATEPAAPKPLPDPEGVPEQLVTEDRRSAFLRRMADKASALGIKTAHFANPSGLTWNSRASANDLLKLGMACAHHPVFSNIWCKVTATVEIKGPHARTVKLRHNYTDLAGWKAFTAKYPFLGGKGGSLGGAKHSVRAHVIVTAIAGKRYVFAISGMKSSKDDPFGLDLEIAASIKAALRGEKSPSTPLLDAHAAIGGGYAWSAFDGSRSHAGPNADKPHVPASTSKMMTALCALDAAGDSRTPVVVRQSDITRGSGIRCYEGDEFSFEDALTAMILSSSNTLAETMSRQLMQVRRPRSCSR